MTRWRVDHEIKSDLVLAKDNKQIVFTSPDNSHEIYLLTRRGPGKHAADELYLSSHVILDDDDPLEAADKADIYLRQFLETLAIVTSAYYRIEKRIMVADWTPGLTNRRFFYFKKFPNPDVPKYALSQEHIETVKTYMANPIPSAVRLAMQWWARGVSVGVPHEQFQYFWYALEILAEYLKPSIKVSSKCPTCNGDLYCQSCSMVPLHKPYPKQALKMLIDKHVNRNPEGFFEIIDEARNRLLHGEDTKAIEQSLGIEWNKLSDSLGKATWVALLDTLGKIAMETTPEETTLALIQTNTFTHYHITLKTEMIMSGAHADPQNPQIEEFQPAFELNMIVSEHQKDSTKEENESVPNRDNS